MSMEAANFSKYIIVVATGCHEWQGSISYVRRTPKGYGYFYSKTLKKNVLAHRYAWSLANNKEIPKNMIIMHKCDNTICVNPDHLTLGSQFDNVQDMITKGRHNFGGMQNALTHCKNGHEYTKSNTGYHTIKGKKYKRCLECHRIQSIKRRKSIAKQLQMI